MSAKFIVSALSVALLTAAAQAAPTHVHGLANLDISVDGNSLVLAFSSPLDNLLGFEHAPRSDAEIAKVQAMAAQLRQSGDLFKPTPAARCKVTDVALTSGALSAVLLAGNTQTRQAAPTQTASTAAPAHDGGEQHADLDMNVTFTCDHAAALTGLDVKLFSYFRGFHQINAQVVTAKRQSHKTLSADDNQLSW